MGPVIKRCVHQLPQLELDANIQPITRTVLRVRLDIRPDFHWDDKVCTVVEITTRQLAKCEWNLELASQLGECFLPPQ
jgi:hypothetical protein